MKIKPICIIPARSGSKRIKNKNIINFFGKPIISYPIIAAKNSKIFSKIIVSTDTKKIEKIVKKFGAECPFIREKKLSDDKSSTKEVLIDAIKKLKTYNVPYHFLVYPTCPTITKEDFVSAYNLIKRKKANALIAVTKYSNSPLRSFCLKKGNIEFNWKNYQKYNSQDLPDHYYDTGTFYIFKTTELIKSKKFLLKKTIPYLIPRNKGVDVNTQDDLNFLNLIFKNKNKKN